MQETKGLGNLYGIGAAVRRTGLSAPVIRIWEKRYGAVIPERTESNRRLYTAEDVERLILLKKLTDHGHAISNIARLDLAQLQSRFAEHEGAPGGNAGEPVASRILVIGPGLEALLNDGRVLETDLVARFSDIPSAVAACDLPATDLLVIAAETLFPETITAVRELAKRSEASRTILIYRFTSSKTAKALARAIDGLTLLQAPLDDYQLRRECLVHLNACRPREWPGPEVPTGPIPERLYDSDQLARLTRISTTVECECPQHMAGLLQSLAAFEKYSAECEDRNPGDALLHALLHRTTAEVRRTMEEALRHLIRVEGIALD